jgi:hypothetical protein
MRLHEAVHVPPLDSAMTSRMAHKWNDTHHDHPIDLFYKESELGSMTLDSKGEGLFVSVKQQDDGSVLLVHLSLLEDDDDDDDDEEEEGNWQPTIKMAFNLTEAGVVEPPQAMEVDDHGNVFLAVSDGVLILKHGHEIIGRLDTPTPITSLTLGEDKYLYIATSFQLLRIRVRNGPPKHPTNLVPKKSTIRHNKA